VTCAFLSEASRQLAGSLDYVATLRVVAGLAVPALADCSALVRIDEEGRLLTLDVASTVPGREEILTDFLRRPPLAPGPISHVLLSKTATLVTDEDDEGPQGFANDAPLSLVRALSACSLVAVPLLTGERIVGVLLCFSIESGRRYTQSDLVLAEDLARRCALAIDNARLYEAAERSRTAAEQSADRLSRLQRVTAALSEAVTVEQVAEVIVRESVAALDASAGTLLMRRMDGDALELVGTVGLSKMMLDAYRRIPLDASTPAAEVVRTGRPLWIQAFSKVAGQFPYFAERSLGNSAYAILPLSLEHNIGGRTCPGI
jgi:transcriptional regulator with GAF, ATPase, and Fis domain